MVKNEIATVNTKNAITTVKSNSEKTNKMLSLDEVKKLFVECGITPKYTDNTNYVGCGTKSNTFSVNVKKTKYNIYCGSNEFDLLDTSDVFDNDSNVLFVIDGNKCDKTRPHYIECTSTTTLKKMLKLVLKNNDKIALAK